MIVVLSTLFVQAGVTPPVNGIEQICRCPGDTVKCVCNTEAKIPTIRKTIKTINMRARRVLISSGALSVNTKKY